MGIEIAIDGPSGSGKSTVAKSLAKALGFVYIDTGAMYRAVALYAAQHGINWNNEVAVLGLLDEISIAIYGQNICLNGINVTVDVRSAEMGVGASVVSTYGVVRTKLVELQRVLAKNRNVVMDGRDIGTVVLANAPVKIFLTASLEARVRRRCTELEALGHIPDLAKITAQIKKRDYDDSNRDVAPLMIAEDAAVIDTSCLDIEGAVAAIMQIVKEKGVL